MLWRRILRIYSQLYAAVFSLFLLALALIASLGSHARLTLDMLPWQGATGHYWLLGAGLAGIVAVILSVKRITQWVLELWALGVLVVLAWGYFLSGYSFRDPGEAWNAFWLVLLALLAAAGACPLKRQNQASS